MLPESLPAPYETDVRRAWMEEAVQWARRRHRHTIDRGGMNPRSAAEKLDDTAMGEIASIAVRQFLRERGRVAVAYDEVRADDYERPDPGWDVAVSRGGDLRAWIAGPPDDPATPPASAHQLSVKASRIPEKDGDDVQTAIERRDFKVFKKSDRVADDLTADFEVQVYFERAQSAWPGDLGADAHPIANSPAEALVDDLRLEARYGRCYITGFCPSRRIVAHHERLAAEGKPQTWPSWHAGHEKTMWRAPLRLGTSPHRLADG